MKVIDLLNKIANGEEVPRKVKYKSFYWEYDKNYDDYRDNDGDWVFSMSNYDITRMLNNKVEILEEPKGIPEKLSFILHGDDIAEIPSNEMLMNKINEIIDSLIYLESKGESNE